MGDAYDIENQQLPVPETPKSPTGIVLPEKLEELPVVIQAAAPKPFIPAEPLAPPPVAPRVSVRKMDHPLFAFKKGMNERKERKQMKHLSATHTFPTYKSFTSRSESGKPQYTVATSHGNGRVSIDPEYERHSRMSGL